MREPWHADVLNVALSGPGGPGPALSLAGVVLTGLTLVTSGTGLPSVARVTDHHGVVIGLRALARLARWHLAASL